MISEPIVIVNCDGCNEELHIIPEYVYRDYTGRVGHYACTEKEIGVQLPDGGWTYEAPNVTYCPECSQERDPNH